MLALKHKQIWEMDTSWRRLTTTTRDKDFTEYMDVPGGVLVRTIIKETYQGTRVGVAMAFVPTPSEAPVFVVNPPQETP